MPTLSQTWALPAALLAVVNLSVTWFNVVSKEVPEPYLDEFFHIPQAQKYCEGDYSWDPKITTPPGLYLVAKLLYPLIGCSTEALRALNVGALCLITPLSYGILRAMRTKAKPSQSAIAQQSDPTLPLDAHSAFNITLFPPLFFFSALFYTDVMSTLVVLLSYSVYLNKTTVAGTLLDNAAATLVGVIALLFRQTNIFWVAIFPAGLTVFDALTSTPPQRSQKTAARVILQDSWNNGLIHDCSVQDAELSDYVLLLVSTVFAVVKRPFLVLRVTIPYLVLLLLFAAFVMWNGSVVLGDKSAHTATLHLPQMLYIWPYIAFFSAPLLIGPLVSSIISIPAQGLGTSLRNWTPNASRLSFFSFVAFAGWVAIGLVAVHFNTIIHPYTLADNRHYVFYVFKIFRLYPAVRYVAVPVYITCAWLTMHALSQPPSNERATTKYRNDRPTSFQESRPPCKSSFIVVWLATTALSVVSAPLVEPRYFIVPWIIWRLNSRTLQASLPLSKKAVLKYDIHPVFETWWLLVINAAVTYVFIRRPFEWPNEPGKVQRFLW